MQRSLGSIPGKTPEDRKRCAKICLAAWVVKQHVVDGLFATLQTVIIHDARMFGGPLTLSISGIVDIAIEF